MAILAPEMTYTPNLLSRILYCYLRQTSSSYVATRDSSCKLDFVFLLDIIFLCYDSG